jgi:RNA polymerase-binding transcription factor DksA
MSMDEIDMANDHIERELAQSLAAARAVKPTPVYLHCLNCGEPVTPENLAWPPLRRCLACASLTGEGIGL